jgi:hypothetical protein
MPTTCCACRRWSELRKHVADLEARLATAKPAV